MTMHRYSERTDRWKHFNKMSERDQKHKQRSQIKSGSHTKFKIESSYFKRKVIPKGFFEVGNHSAQNLKLKKCFSEQKKTSFDKEKIFCSYSQVKQKLPIPFPNEEFLIRIPKNQNLIENYIEQLKYLKRKIVQNRSDSLNLRHGRRQIRPKHQNHNQQPVTPQRSQNISFLTHFENAQHLIKEEQRIFSREIKKHLQKIKMLNEFKGSNQRQHLPLDRQDKQKQSISLQGKFQTIFKPFANKVEKRSETDWDKKLIYGKIIKLIQFEGIPSKKYFNRYSSERGRRLFSISKSLDLKKKIPTEQQIEKHFSPNHLLKRRRTQQAQRKVQQKQSSLKNIFTRPHQTVFKFETSPQQNPKIGQTQLKVQRQNNQAKPLEEVDQQPFKNIEGFSTIQAQKETIDLLGESCSQIKKNLIQSNEKIDHILDLLGYNINQIKATGRQKKKRISCQKFSKVFPKGFFK